MGAGTVLRDSWRIPMDKEIPINPLMPPGAQAELLTAFGGGPTLERRPASLSAVAEDAKPAGSPIASLPKCVVAKLPVAEHLPSASLTSSQEMYRPSTIGGCVLRQQHSLGASLLSWPALSVSLPPLSSVRATPRTCVTAAHVAGPIASMCTRSQSCNI